MLKKRTRKIFLGLELLVCGYMLYTIIFHQQSLMNHKKREMQEIKQKIENEKKLTDELNEEKAQIGTDEYIEKIAREKLGMIKKDEIIFYSVD